MATNKIVNASEEEARELAETSRESAWQGKSFLRDLFLGSLRMDWIDPFPHTPFTEEFKTFYRQLNVFLRDEVDSVKIDAEGKYPDSVIKGLTDLGAFARARRLVALVSSWRDKRQSSRQSAPP